MKNLIQNQSSNPLEPIVQGCMAVDTSLETVKFLFLNHEVYEIHHLKKDKIEISLEIEFDSLTLFCSFDTNHICESVFLMPNDTTDLIHCIDHCNKTYPYDRLLKGWVICNRIIQINTYNGECSLSILPIKFQEGS